MKIAYFYHDCFLLECEKCSVLTDYFDSVPVECLNRIDASMPLYVLISHHHKDHFTPDIFSFWQRFPKVRYIISNDTRRAVGYMLKQDSGYCGRNALDDRGRVIVLKHGEQYRAPDIVVDAFPSTDIGNSYVLNLGDEKIFFAGDLNAWILQENESFDKDMMNRYRKILETIKLCHSGFDVVFFPIDPRLRERSTYGAHLFMECFDVGTLVPMHFALWNDVDS